MGVKASWNERSHTWVVVSGPPPFLPGDAIVSIEGLPIGFHEWLADNIYIQSRKELMDWFGAKNRFSAAVAKPSVRAVLGRGGQTIEVRAPVSRTGFSFLGKIEALHWVIGAAFFFVGLVVFWKKGFERALFVSQKTGVVSREMPIVFFLMSFVMMLLFVTNATSMACESVYAPGYFALMNLINVGSTFFGAALMLHFSLLMPEKRRFLVRFPRLVWVYYILCGLVVGLLSFPVMNVVFPAFFLLGLAAMTVHFFRSRDPIKRQQLKWVLAGFCSGLLPFVLINGIPMILTGQRLVNDTIPGLFLILVPLFTAFAIQKFHLMEIDTLFDNTLVYGATFALLSVVDVAVAGLFSRLLSNKGDAAGPLAGVVSFWLVVISYVPVRNRMRIWVDRLLKREQYDLNEVSTELSGRLILAPDPARALGEAWNVIRRTVHPRGICACLFSEPGPGYVFHVGWPDAPVDIADRARSLNGASYLYTLLPDGETAEDYASGVACPLRGQTGPIGCIILKNRISGRPYSRKDLSLLNMVGRQLSLALENIAAKETALAREQESQEVKEHISREMHDGIGGTFSNAIMMLDLMSGDPSAAENRNRIGAMRDTLTDGLAETRALIRTMEEKETALSDLKENVEDKVRRLLSGKNVECRFEANIDDYDLEISPLVVHNITKIVQEAVMNALKHSRAGRISVALRETGGELSVVIADDGRGLEHGPRRADRYGLRNIERRCSEMGASLELHSRPGEGFEITVSLKSGT
jgi:signal transduction histidine kinase